MTRQEVYELIDGEREYQDAQITNGRFEGGSNQKHEVGAYITMLTHYVNKLQEAWTMNHGDQAALDVMRKCAGIAVHCMEDHGAPARKVTVAK